MTIRASRNDNGYKLAEADDFAAVWEKLGEQIHADWLSQEKITWIVANISDDDGKVNESYLVELI